MSKAYSKRVHLFENSEENVIRSVATYYSSGVMGKRKYKAVRLVLSTKTSKRKCGGRTSLCIMRKCAGPKLSPYNKLIGYINQIDFGKVYSVEEEFSDYLADDEVIHGCFRDLREFQPRLAKFYFQIKNKCHEALNWFGQTEGTFLVVFGGDGCPFGRNKSACSFLLSFLNVGKCVASSADNFLTFGANCESESCAVVRNYVKSVCKQISDIEGKVFDVDGIHVTFKFSELPNDMKMLALLARELPNSAKYFSTFANVHKENCKKLNGTFGAGNNNTWQPWEYKSRLKVVKEVEQFKLSLAGKPMSDKLRRSKVTEFIAHKKSRQEFTPLVGELINEAHVEPLHLKNNAWQLFFKGLLKESISKSNLPPSCKKFADVPKDSCFSRVVNALRYEVKCKCLARKVTKWFDETEAKGSDLQYRFTGKDSRLFCHNFMRLIKFLSCEDDSRKQRLTVLVYAFIGLRLRDCVSLFNRFEITNEQIQDLTTKAQEYFRANALFLPTSVNPTVWTLGNIVAAHCKEVFQKYGQGLCTVTMEGREAKHIFFKEAL